MEKDFIVQQLKEKGLSITRQRLAIIDVLVEMGHEHPGVSFIYREAKKKHKSLSLSTTYATINELIGRGIIMALEFDGKEKRCEANLEEHINLICYQCGKIIDYKPSINVDLRDVAKKTGFVITSNRWEYYGFCQECSAERKLLQDDKAINPGKKHNRRKSHE